MARRRLLLLAKSYFARGGTGAEPGVTSPRGLRELRWNAGSGAAPPPLPPAGETRASPGRAPRAPRRLCSPPGLGRPPLRGSGGGKGDLAPLAALFQKPEFETENLVSSVAGPLRTSAGTPSPPQQRCAGVASPRWRAHPSGCGEREGGVCQRPGETSTCADSSPLLIHEIGNKTPLPHRKLIVP